MQSRGRRRNFDEFAQGNLDAAPEATQDDNLPDPLVTWSLLKFAQGALNATDVRECAHRQVLSGQSSVEAKKIAQMGAFGQSAQHTYEQLMNKYLANVELAPCDNVHIPCIDPTTDTNKLIYEYAGVINPHEWYSALEHHYPETFDKVIGIQKIAQFWAEVPRDDPRLHNHPMLGEDQWNLCFCPLLAHGDAGEYQNNDSMESLSTSGYIGDGSTEDTQTLFTMWPKSCTATTAAHGASTWSRLWKRFVWSLNVLYSGFFPYTDDTGRPYTERDGRHYETRGQPLFKRLVNGLRLRFVFWGQEGDWDFHASLGLMTAGNHLFCHLCDCNSDDTPGNPMAWNFFGRGQKWSKTFVKPAAFCFETARLRFKHEIWDIIGFSLWHFLIDPMHTLDGGVSTHVVAGTLHFVSYGSDRRKRNVKAEAASNLATYWEEVQNDKCHTVTKMSLKNICSPDSPWSEFPSLKHIKCADTRHLIPALHRASQKLFGSSEEERSVKLLLRCLSRMYEIMDEPTMFLSKKMSAEFIECTWDFLKMYSLLASEANKVKILRWAFVPKFHMLVHIADMSRYYNPATVWCYQGEDFVGKVILICEASSRGTPHYQVARKGCERWRLMMHISITRQ